MPLTTKHGHIVHNPVETATKIFNNTFNREYKNEYVVGAQDIAVMADWIMKNVTQEQMDAFEEEYFASGYCIRPDKKDQGMCEICQQVCTDLLPGCTHAQIMGILWNETAFPFLDPADPEQRAMLEEQLKEGYKNREEYKDWDDGDVHPVQDTV